MITLNLRLLSSGQDSGDRVDDEHLRRAIGQPDRVVDERERQAAEHLAGQDEVAEQKQGRAQRQRDEACLLYTSDAADE